VNKIDVFVKSRQKSRRETALDVLAKARVFEDREEK